MPVGNTTAYIVVENTSYNTVRVLNNNDCKNSRARRGPKGTWCIWGGALFGWYISFSPAKGRRVKFVQPSRPPGHGQRGYFRRRVVVDNFYRGSVPVVLCLSPEDYYDWGGGGKTQGTYSGYSFSLWVLNIFFTLTLPSIPLSFS